MTKLTADYTDANRAVAALRCRVSALKDSKLISCSDVNCGKTAMMAEKKSKTRSRYSIGEWYGRAFEFFSPKQRRDQAKLHAGLTTIAGLDCPFQKNRICTKKAGVCSLRKYEQIDDGPVKGTGPLVTTCPNRFLEDDTIFRWVGEEILQTKTPIILGQIGFLDRLRPEETADDEERFPRLHWSNRQRAGGLVGTSMLFPCGLSASRKVSSAHL